VITARILNSESVALQLGGFPLRLLPELKNSMLRAVIMLQAYIITTKLSGDPLHVKTGRLRRSIHHEVQETSTGLEAQVGTNVPYAFLHEYGWSGIVPAHMRRIAYNANKRSSNYGERITLRKALSPKMLAHSMISEVEVKAHKMVIPERSFLRSALAELSPYIFHDLEAATAKAMRGWG
jgi:phage gpG-like protein